MNLSKIRQYFDRKKLDFRRWRQAKWNRSIRRMRFWRYVVANISFVKWIALTGFLVMAIGWLLLVALTVNKAGQYYATNQDFRLAGSLLVLMVEGLAAIIVGGMAAE